MKKEALLYEKSDNQSVNCFLCSHHCKISDQKFGFCGVRQNLGGALFTYAYGEVIAAHVDPIEKKPLYHFLPGSNSFSVATVGCNFRCEFCQNWEISQCSFRDGPCKGTEFLPIDIVNEALKNKCTSISYTYTEPTIFFEYAYETAKLTKEHGLKNIFVTNGYMSAECLELIKPYLDAANVDLKFFKEESYRNICAGSLQPVLNSIKLMKKMGIWVEVTTLIIPGQNDSDEELRAIADFIVGIDKNMPWHVSRFHPDYKLTQQHATPEATLEKAVAIGKKAGLEFVYAGNVYGFGSDTSCPICKKYLIKREGFNILEYNIKQGQCLFCQEDIAGVFE
ncbi:MAG: AmmeMemoRadiSam system radical SAM enzyme [Candidatus Omnitrophica bacterium]|jgi:pyruvate formate lyase activating enzyme|nr:AmmeMemoRadiSam system radical SAM enzyme [Candidatus Omnitrophota bacterium]